MNFLKKLATNKGEGSPGQVQGVHCPEIYNLNGKPGEWFCPRRRKCAKHVEQLAAEICQGMQLQHEGCDKGRQKYWQICFTCSASGDFLLLLKIYKIIVQCQPASNYRVVHSWRSTRLLRRYRWLPSTGATRTPRTLSRSPNILSTLIDLFTFLGGIRKNFV